MTVGGRVVELGCRSSVSGAAATSKGPRRGVCSFSRLEIRRAPSPTREAVMAESIKDKLEETGHKIAETATKVGHRVGEKVEEATDWAKEKAHQVGNRIEET